MTRFSLLPLSDVEQRLRFRRYLIAAATSIMFVVLLTLCLVEGVLSGLPFAVASLFTLLAIAVFYALFRSGWNKRARDRSLTVPMMACATGAVTFVLYYVGLARPVFLLMYPVILFFGVFRLQTSRLLGVASLALAGYALVIWLLLQTPPGLGRPHIEMLQWIVLSAVLVWFSIMVGYVNQLHARLKESEYDELTGIYTRRRILQVLEHEKIRCDRGAGPLCICMLDIDRFKQVNDSFGHAAGDEVLRRSVQVAQNELRAIDFIGRYGGEEFGWVLLSLAARAGRIGVWKPLKRAGWADEGLQVLAQFGLDPHAERLVGELPEGSRKLLDIALAVALRPRLLLMDEPTAGVSTDDKFEVMDTLVGVISGSGITTIFVEHDMDVVLRYSQRVLVFDQGLVIAEGEPAAVLADPEVRRAVLGHV